MEKTTIKHALRHWKNSIDTDHKGGLTFPKAALLVSFIHGAPNKFIHHMMNKFLKLSQKDKINPCLVSEKLIKEKLNLDFPPGRDIFVNRRKYDVQIIYREERISNIPLAVDIRDFDSDTFDFLIHSLMNIIAAVDFAEGKTDMAVIAKRCKAFGSEFIRSIKEHLINEENMTDITFSDYLTEIENQFELGVYDLTDEELGIDESDFNDDNDNNDNNDNESNDKDLLDFD